MFMLLYLVLEAYPVFFNPCLCDNSPSVSYNSNFIADFIGRLKKKPYGSGSAGICDSGRTRTFAGYRVRTLEKFAQYGTVVYILSWK